MGKLDSHLLKYKNFKEEAINGKYIPSKIENYFLSAFHLIEAVLSKYGIHTGVHKRLFKLLKEKEDIFEENTLNLMDSFRRIERDLRPGVMYGSKENGEKLKEVIERFMVIEKICIPFLSDLDE